MLVIIIAAVATWVVPAGRYDTVTYSENSFLVTTDSNSVSLPFAKHTLDSLQIHITPEKFASGAIRKPVCHYLARFIASKKIHKASLKFLKLH